MVVSNSFHRRSQAALQVLQKKVVTLRDEYGLTFSDIGKRLGANTTYVNDLYRRAKGTDRRKKR